MWSSWLVPEGKKILLNQCFTRFLAQIEGRILPYRPLLFNQTFPLRSAREIAAFQPEKQVGSMIAAWFLAAVRPL
jgi:hypothetical protein